MPLGNDKYPCIVEKSKENFNATLNQFQLNRFQIWKHCCKFDPKHMHCITKTLARF